MFALHCRQLLRMQFWSALSLCIALAAVSKETAFANEHYGDDDEVEVHQSAWSLERLVQRAVETHPSIISRKMAVSASEAELRAARWQYLPSPSVSGEQVEGDEVLTLQLTQPIWSGGRLSAGVDVAKSQLQRAHWAVADAQHQIAEQIISHFNSATSAASSVRIYDTYIGNLSRLEAMMRRRVAQGYSADVDVKLVMSRISQARSAYTSLVGTRDASVGALTQLVGSAVSSGDLADPSGTTSADLRGLTRDLVISTAIRVNPALRLGSADVSTARARTHQAKSELLPTFFARLRHRESSGLGISDDGTDFVLGFEFALGGGLSSLEGVRASVAQEAEAVGTRQAALVGLTVEVVADLETYQSAVGLLEELSANRVTQQEIYESYARMFLVGRRTWLDVLNVMREQLEVELSLARARSQIAASEYLLRIRMGEVPWLAR